MKTFPSTSFPRKRSQIYLWSNSTEVNRVAQGIHLANATWRMAFQEASISRLATLLSSVSQVTRIYSAGYISPLYYPTHTSRKPSRNDRPQSTTVGSASRILVRRFALFPAPPWFYFIVWKKPEFTVTWLMVSGKLWALVNKQEQARGSTRHITAQSLLHRRQNCLRYSS